MRISGFEKFSMVDYPGKIACTVFTEGCNLRCPFCHNSGLVLSERFLGDDLTPDVLRYLKKRRGLVDAVCVSGGEPTLNRDLPEFIKKVQDMGYLVKLDTNGLNPSMLRALYKEKLIDYVAMDIKGSSERYPEITGTGDIDHSKIAESVRLIMSGGVDYEFRTTLIRDFHSAEDFSKLGALLKGAKNYYLQKYNDDDNCIARGFTPVDKAEAESFAEILLNNGVLRVGLRGY